METLLFAALIGILFAVVITMLRPRPSPPIVYIAAPQPEVSSLGCLPLVLAVVFTFMVLLLLRG